MSRFALSLLCSATLVLCLPGEAASAADMRVKAPVYKAPKATSAYNWTGWYVGANIGGAWSDVALTDSALGVGLNPGGTGFIGGLQTGYNFQTGNFLYGVEGDFDWTTFQGTTGAPTALGLVQASDRKDWITTLAGRLGVTSDRLLVYGKIGGGWARSSATLSFVNGGPIWGGSQTNGGWLLGVGMEYAFASNWTGKLEYDYLGISNTTASAPPVTAANHDIQMLKVGVNYQFGERVAPGEASKKPSSPEAHDDDALATASQNPISSMISMPFENNANFNTGPFDRTQDVLDIEPVIPIHLNSDWNLISRTIMPLMSQPDPVFDSNSNGIGDITEELFFSPVHPEHIEGDIPFIWGAGPVFTMPSASDPTLGTGKTLVGPTAVALVTPKHWVIGVLVNNQWSVAGDPDRKSVNAFLAQPFVNYNMSGGWYLVSSPMITADWTAAAGQKWTVPLGGGVGRVFKVSGQAYSASVQAFYNVVHPDNAANWQLRAYLALLFPE